MPDEFDIASDISERERANSEALLRDKAHKKEAEPTGFCLNCEDEVTGVARWCSPECRDDWDTSRRFK